MNGVLMDRASFERALLHVEVEHLLTWLAECGAPEHTDLELSVEASTRVHELKLVSIAGQAGLFRVEVASLLGHLRKNDREYVTAHYLVTSPVVELLDVVTTDKNGHLVRDVAATVTKTKQGTLSFPLSRPLHVAALNLLRGLSEGDSIRLLAELIRLLSEAVRCARLTESTRRDRIRDLSVLARIACALLRDDGNDQTSNPRQPCQHFTPRDRHGRNATDDTPPTEDGAS